MNLLLLLLMSHLLDQSHVFDFPMLLQCGNEAIEELQRVINVKLVLCLIEGVLQGES